MLKVLQLYESTLNGDGAAEGVRINVFPGPGFLD